MTLTHTAARYAWSCADEKRLRQLAARGLLNHEIATDLGRSVKAIENRRSRLRIPAPKVRRLTGAAAPANADVHVVGQWRNGARSVLTTFTGPEALVRAEAWARLAAPQLEAFAAISVEPGGKGEVLRVVCGKE